MITNNKLLLLFLTSFFSSWLYAQDVIYKTDGSKVEGEVESVDSYGVSYTSKKPLSKLQTLSDSLVAFIIFQNGHYLTLPSTKDKIDAAFSSGNLENDFVITRFAELIECTIQSFSKTEVEILSYKDKNVIKLMPDEVFLAVYRDGRHVLLKNPIEAKPMLEYTYSQMAFLFEKANPVQTVQSSSNQALGRPSHLSAKGNSSNPSALPQQALPSVNSKEVVVSSTSTVSQSISATPISEPINSGQVVISSTPSSTVSVPPKQASRPATVQDFTQTLPTTSSTVTPVEAYPQKNTAIASLGYSTIGQSAKAPTVSVENFTTPRELTDIDFDEFSDKALQKIDDFTRYLSIIASKETYPETANQAIDLAIELFVNEEVVVEVSTAGYAASVKRKIRDYLTRLKLLKYDRVEIQWADINYVSNFRKGPDGNYYGTLTVKQTFRGYKDNQVVYSDVTQKDVEVVIKGMEKSVQGQKEMVWDVLLSDIGVLDTK